MEPPEFAALRLRVATALRTEASAIAGRWEEQSRVVALREASVAGVAGSPFSAASLITAMADSLASDGATSDTLVALGLSFGVQAFARGGSLHHTLKGLDLLAAMTLYVVESSLLGESGATAADGVRVCRRLQQASSLVTLAATKGHTEAMSDAMRERFRHLRHDLRNPLGTIKSVLAMMDDETMPAEARAHPRFRAMAKRNARSLGELIADRLSDAEAVVPVLVQQSASLRTIACGVRRALRAEAEVRGATVVIGSARARVMVDAVGLEFMLHELLRAALQEAESGDELRVEFGEVRDESASVTLYCAPSRCPVIGAEALARLTALATHMRGKLAATEEAVNFEIPVRRVEMTVQPPEAASTLPVEGVADSAPVAVPPSAGREPGDDVRGAREGEHGQSRTL
jgi:signal transduction histidine kinase